MSRIMHDLHRRARIETLAKSGLRPIEIAAELECSSDLVRAVMSQLRKEGVEIPIHRKVPPQVVDPHGPQAEAMRFKLYMDDLAARCEAHLADLVAAYGPAPEPKVQPEGPARYYRGAPAVESYCGSPAAMIAELG